MKLPDIDSKDLMKFSTEINFWGYRWVYGKNLHTYFGMNDASSFTEADLAEFPDLISEFSIGFVNHDKTFDVSMQDSEHSVCIYLTIEDAKKLIDFIQSHINKVENDG